MFGNMKSTCKGNNRRIARSWLFFKINLGQTSRLSITLCRIAPTWICNCVVVQETTGVTPAAGLWELWIFVSISAHENHPRKDFLHRSFKITGGIFLAHTIVQFPPNPRASTNPWQLAGSVKRTWSNSVTHSNGLSHTFTSLYVVFY